MGSMIGHVLPGIGFLLVGLWHLFSHIKLHALHPTSYTALAWFPTSKHRHLELFFIMAGSSVFVVIELFIGPARHQPLDTDGTIPHYHLHTFEHATISVSLFTYSLLSLMIDRGFPSHGNKLARNGLSLFLGAVAFGLELLLFHLHSADHAGPEAQFHMLLQLLILTSLITTLMGIGFPKSFMVSFVRSLSIFFQGVWFIVMGVTLWTPALIAKGCWLNDEDGRLVVRCDGEASLHRAKSLANLLFSYFVIGISVFGVYFYLHLAKIFGEKDVESYLYEELIVNKDTDDDDVEAQKTSSKLISKTTYTTLDHVGGFQLVPR